MAVKLGKCGKQKTSSPAKKRFQKTGSGKWKGGKAGGRHLLLQKSKSQKKLKSKGIILEKGDAQTVSKLMPNG